MANTIQISSRAVWWIDSTINGNGFSGSVARNRIFEMEGTKQRTWPEATGDAYEKDRHSIQTKSRKPLSGLLLLRKMGHIPASR
ncbi:MAG: hypothetical protein ACLVEJ_04895 [Parabacteroides sp.]